LFTLPNAHGKHHDLFARVEKNLGFQKNNLPIFCFFKKNVFLFFYKETRFFSFFKENGKKHSELFFLHHALSQFSELHNNNLL